MTGAMHFPRIGRCALLLACLSGGAVPALAQTGTFELELNTSADVGEGCRLTFVATNNTNLDLTQASYEMAVFGADNVYTMSVIFEFGDLPKSKTRVVQFDLPDGKCEAITRILVNRQDKCTAGDGEHDICTRALTASSRIQNIGFGL